MKFNYKNMLITPFIGLSILTHIIIIIYYGIVQIIQNNREIINKVLKKYFGFLGLPIFVDMFVIAFYIFFKITQANRERFNSIFKKYFGFVVIIFIFGFIFTSAVSLIFLSVTEKHSTIVFLRDSKIFPILANAVYSITIKIDSAV